MMMVEQKIAERRSAVLKDWPSFLMCVSPFVVSTVIDRSKAGLPDDFVPWAPGVVIASDYLLRAAGYCSGSLPPDGWCSGRPGFTRVIFRNRLTIRECGEFWFIERETCEVLAHSYGSLPVFNRTYQAAMWLAEFCHPRPLEGENSHPCPRGVASCLRWVMSTPTGVRWC